MVVMLRQGEALQRPIAYAEVSWRLDGPSRSETRVDVRRADGAELARGLIRRPSPNSLVVTAVPAALTLTIVAANGQPFPATTTVHTSITLTQRDGNREQVVLDAADVTGVSEQELLGLEPAEDDEWELRASAGVEDVALEGLARLVYYTARRQTPRVSPGSVPGPVPTVAIDVSASMTPLIRGGALASLLEVLAGLYSWSYGAASSVPVWALGASSEPVSAGWPTAKLADIVADELMARPVESGALHVALVRAAGVRPTGKLVIITDGVPGDGPRLSAARAAAAYPLSCDYVVLARSSFDTDELARPAPGRDELAGMARLRSEVGVVSIAPSTVGELEADTRRLDLLVAALKVHVLR